MTNTVPYYEDFSEIKKKIWLMLDDAVTNRSSPFRIPVFVCGNQSDFDGRIVVLRKSDQSSNILQCNIESIEWLYLAAKGHRRARFDFSNNKQNWLVP